MLLNQALVDQATQAAAPTMKIVMMKSKDLVTKTMRKTATMMKVNQAQVVPTADLAPPLVTTVAHPVHLVHLNLKHNPRAQLITIALTSKRAAIVQAVAPAHPLVPEYYPVSPTF